MRDATFTLYALMGGGFVEEARAWRQWLLRAVAGNPAQLQIMYGVAGERRLTELELDWLPGYENSRPVRIGNAAARQFQLDVFGELMDGLYVARRAGLEEDENAWRVQRVMLKYLEEHWTDPDEGIWEVRGPRRHFTHSKVMAWVAVDRMIKTAKPLSRRRQKGFSIAVTVQASTHAAARRSAAARRAAGRAELPPTKRLDAICGWGPLRPEMIRGNTIPPAAAGCGIPASSSRPAGRAALSPGPQ